MIYLTKQNFLCPLPIIGSDGEALSVLKDKPALMVSFLEGKEKNIIDALKDIEKLDVVKGKIVKIRIEELES